jgi:hypothetical protein
MNTNLKRLLTGLAVFLFIGVGSAQAAEISGLFNTGVDNTKTLLGDNMVDTHYVIDPSWIAIAGNNPPPAFPNAWLLNSSSSASRWITPVEEPGPSTSETLYVLTLNFDLSGFDPATASFSGRWATDNSGDVFLNGGLVSLGHSNTFNDWSPFSANSGFVSGLNTLAFHVTNRAFDATNPTGLRVEFQESSIVAIPEPEIYAMMLLGLGLMGFVARRRQGGQV